MSWYALLFGPDGWIGLLLRGAVVTVALSVTTVPFGFGAGLVLAHAARPARPLARPLSFTLPPRTRATAPVAVCSQRSLVVAAWLPRSSEDGRVRRARLQPGLGVASLPAGRGRLSSGSLHSECFQEMRASQQ